MATRKTRTVKTAASKDADPLNNPECLAELTEEARAAQLEVERGPDQSGWQHNETLRPAITERAAFYAALLKLPALAKYLSCLLLVLALGLGTLRADDLSGSLFGPPQVGDSVWQLEARTAMALWAIAANGTAKTKIWDGTTPLTINTDGSLNVNVLNFPTTQAVSGTFWQATQPVSVAALPLPAGAATSAKQDASQATLATIAANTTPVVAVTNSYRNITTTGATLIKSGAGVLHTVCINSLGTVASVVAIYDSTAASGAKIATINSLSLGGAFTYDVAFSNGLTVTTTGVLAPDITVSYR